MYEWWMCLRCMYLCCGEWISIYFHRKSMFIYAALLLWICESIFDALGCWYNTSIRRNDVVAWLCIISVKTTPIILIEAPWNVSKGHYIPHLTMETWFWQLPIRKISRVRLHVRRRCYQPSLSMLGWYLGPCCAKHKVLNHCIYIEVFM